MKKMIIVGAVLVMAASLFAASAAESAPKQFTVAVGSLRGTMGRLGAGLTDLVNKKQSAFKLSIVPGGGRGNPARIGGGGADIGYSFSNFASNALSGSKPYKKAYPNLRGIAKFFDSCYHQYAAKEQYDAGIKSWKDIVMSKKPLNVAPAKKGTSTEYVASLIVAHKNVICPATDPK